MLQEWKKVIRNANITILQY